MRSVLVTFLLAFAGASLASEQPPTLTIGSALPAFSLPGIDGKTYTDQSFKDANILVLVFTCAHCPTAQAYQERIKKLVTDYSPKKVTVLAINPNHEAAVRLDELAYTDLSDSFAEMQERAKQEKFNFVWLDDGPKQELSHKMGPVATPPPSEPACRWWTRGLGGSGCRTEYRPGSSTTRRWGEVGVDAPVALEPAPHLGRLVDLEVVEHEVELAASANHLAACKRTAVDFPDIRPSR